MAELYEENLMIFLKMYKDILSDPAYDDESKEQAQHFIDKIEGKDEEEEDEELNISPASKLRLKEVGY